MSQSAKFRGKPVDVVLDVRSKLEFWMGHLDGAVCVPVDRIPDGMGVIAGLTPASRILVYCASGARSAAATARLKAAGFVNVVDGGGIAAAQQEFVPGTS
jgi:rhodanese-related sulfurtransferase